MIHIKFSNVWHFAKWRVLGNCFSNPEEEIWQHLETIISFGFLRLNIKHKMKFVDYKKKDVIKL